MPDAANPYAPPAANVQLPPDNTCWREGREVVLRRGADLPPRCIRCNAPDVQPVKRRQYEWHHPLIFLLVPVILFYFIVAMIARQRVWLSPGLCRAHTRERRLALGVSIVLIIGSFYALSESVTSRSSLLPLIIGSVLLLAAVAVGLAKGGLVRPTRIDRRYIRLRGCSPHFLESLPDSEGAAAPAAEGRRP